MNLNTVNVKILVFRAEIHQMLIRIANREDPDQVKKQSGLACAVYLDLFCSQLVFENFNHTLQKSTCVVFVQRLSSVIFIFCLINEASIPLHSS